MGMVTASGRQYQRRFDWEQARTRYQAGETMTAIAASYGVTKEAVRRIQAERRLADGDDLMALTYTSADFREGVRAFLEKRPPRWSEPPTA